MGFILLEEDMNEQVKEAVFKVGIFLQVFLVFLVFCAGILGVLFNYLRLCCICFSFFNRFNIV